MLQAHLGSPVDFLAAFVFTLFWTVQLHAAYGLSVHTMQQDNQGMTEVVKECDEEET